jgi:hypothetical protein
MSHQAIEAALTLPITDHRKRLALVLLAHHHNAKTGSCIPGQEKMADKACCTDRTMRAYLREWETAGYITRKPRYDDRGKRTSDSYTLHFLEPRFAERLPETTASGSGLPEKSASLPENMRSGIKNRSIKQKPSLPGKDVSCSDSLGTQGTSNHTAGPPDDAASFAARSS